MWEGAVLFTSGSWQRLKPFRTQQHFGTVDQVFVTSQMDYCHALYFGLSQHALKCLKMLLLISYLEHVGGSI